MIFIVISIICNKLLQLPLNCFKILKKKFQSNWLIKKKYKIFKLNKQKDKPNIKAIINFIQVCMPTKMSSKFVVALLKSIFKSLLLGISRNP